MMNLRKAKKVIKNVACYGECGVYAERHLLAARKRAPRLYELAMKRHDRDPFNRLMRRVAAIREMDKCQRQLDAMAER